MKKLLFALILMFSLTSIYSQTLEELKSEQATKKDSINALQSKVDDLQGKIDTYPGWRKGAIGTIGGNMAGSNYWYSNNVPNSSTGNLGFTVNGWANLDKEKFFWKNDASVKLTWVKLDDKDDPNDDDNFAQSTDVFNITSLYGHKLNSKFALSALAEYRTTLLSNFNDPGYLDLGIGATWTPVKGLVVVFHPLNYNFVFSSEDDIYESSLGAKILADYARDFGDLKFKTNLSMFQSYKSSNYSNWTWTNTFGYTLWKNLGLGFEFALRKNKQEALDYNINTLGIPSATFSNIDNKLQSYWLFGLNYTL